MSSPAAEEKKISSRFLFPAGNYFFAIHGNLNFSWYSRELNSSGLFESRNEVGGNEISSKLYAFLSADAKIDF